MTQLNTIDTHNIAGVEKQLRYISSIIKEKGRVMLKEFDINPPQFVALQWISDEDGITIGDLSNRMYLAFSTTTDLVDRMENKGLVERKKDEQDKRVVRIHLLPKGYDTISSVIRKRQDYLADRMDVLDEDELEGFRAGLEVLFQQMKHDF